MTKWEKLVRDLLQARTCVCGVAKDPDVAYKILAQDLEYMVRFRREVLGLDD